VASVALQEAIEELQQVSRSDLPPKAQGDEVFHLDVAMGYLRRLTPPA
jgi:hypothetical protein